MVNQKEALIKCKGSFNASDIFKIVLSFEDRRGDKFTYSVKQKEIDINEAREAMKNLITDFKKPGVTAYCMPGFSFREYWKSLIGHGRQKRTIFTLKEIPFTIHYLTNPKNGLKPLSKYRYYKRNKLISQLKQALNSLFKL